MGVSLVRFLDKSDPNRDKKLQWGLLENDTVRPLAIDEDHHRDVMALFFERRPQFEAALETRVVKLADVEFVAPLSRQIQLLAQGLNYIDHRVEGGYQAKTEQDASTSEENLLFQKASSTISAPNVTILRPTDTKLLDYEIELGIVLKRDIVGAVTVTDDNLNDYVGGWILCNDVSSRDEMFGAPAMQWYKGKSQRTFCPAGPVLFLPEQDDFKQLYNLRLQLKLNGQTMQDALTSQLIHKPPKTISELSCFSDLSSGDCILTGTPGGVLTQLTTKAALAILLNMRNDTNRRKKFTKAQLVQSKFLQPGDILELEIVSTDGAINLGRQRNEIADLG